MSVVCVFFDSSQMWMTWLTHDTGDCYYGRSEIIDRLVRLDSKPKLPVSRHCRIQDAYSFAPCAAPTEMSNQAKRKPARGDKKKPGVGVTCQLSCLSFDETMGQLQAFWEVIVIHASGVPSIDNVLISSGCFQLVCCGPCCGACCCSPWQQHWCSCTCCTLRRGCRLTWRWSQCCASCCGSRWTGTDQVEPAILQGWSGVCVRSRICPSTSNKSGRLWLKMGFTHTWTTWHGSVFQFFRLQFSNFLMMLSTGDVRATLYMTLPVKLS